MKHIAGKILITALLLFTFQDVSANALTVTNVSYDQGAKTVSFTLNWQNSWKISTVPFNWDAVWTFVKFRQCGVENTVDWDHGVLSYAGSTFGGLEATTVDGTAGAFDADNLGAMLRHPTDTIAPVAGPYNITLSVTNLPTTYDLNVKVFGIEMVFVNEGAFYVGDGTDNNQCEFYPAQLIDSEVHTAPFTFETSYLGGTANNIVAKDGFPKGYAAFYCMKYEITHGQYVDFLNTINSVAQSVRYYYDTGYRHRLYNTGTPPDIYFTDRKDRALNYADWADHTAYLDWAALRPMTEFEYEKACRGQNAPLPNEYAWGSTSITDGNLISAAEDGTEVILDVNSNCNYSGTTTTFSGGGDGGQGPLRVGIFAKNSTDRQLSGATYYGIMDMSGNLWERVVCFSPYTNDAAFAGNTWGQEHTRVYGDGYLDAAGQHDVVAWPPWNASTLAVIDYTLCSIRGGSWGDGGGAGYLNVSSRPHTGYWNGHYGRSTSVGGRGVR